ncbi:hypothetical protein VTJ49DRAFT_3461 [Mycothermus thermophilus]|uniref:Uncharacterized protein n=1 Tax=Humicola insolens TaxID=85995 RepID=A0ABR3VM73_HUMIN
MNGNIFFTFGPTPGSYILDTPRRFCTSGLPYAMKRGLTNVRKVHWAVFGDNGNAAFMYTGTAHEEGLWRWHSDAFKSRLPKAHGFIEKKSQEGGAANISVTLGKGESIVICAPDRNQVHGCVDESIKERIMAYDRIRHVALGVGDAYVIFHSKGIAYNLRGNYDKLDRILDSLSAQDISYAALNPWRAEEFVLVLADGTVRFSVHESIKDDLMSALRDSNGSQTARPRRQAAMPRSGGQGLHNQIMVNAVGGAAGGVASGIVQTGLAGFTPIATAQPDVYEFDGAAEPDVAGFDDTAEPDVSGFTDVLQPDFSGFIDPITTSGCTVM